MSLVNLIKLEYSVGGPLLLDGVDFALERNERVCVVGRNGAGKSTLLRLIAGELKPEHGEARVESGLVIARLAQELPRGTAGSVYDVVADALGHIGAWLAEYHHLTQGAEHDEHRLAAVQAKIEAEHGWNLEQRVTNTLERLQLPIDAEFATLSGGMQRRVLLARALVVAPDVLLLDEPTNHLDIDAIAWLERMLLDFPGSVVFVTHDRRFLRALATRIVEIDRGRLTSWPGDYDNYLRRREERANAEALEHARFDKKLAQEEVWIRQGIKARRTRSEGRVRALEAMRRERAARREAGGTVRIAANEAAGSGRKVIEASGAGVALGGRVLVRDFSTLVLRGDKVGVIGPNGSGKTTLLKLLLGELAPDAGTIRLGTNLQVAYFDQQRAQLREDLSAADNVADGAEFIELEGGRKHVLGYLQEFLFSPAQARAPITALSGGERNRLLLARLFAKPFNLLVMDEPTNDLDIETLELLEELLAAFNGTLLLVSHDREFIDNVVTSTLVLEGDGKVGEYVGGYSDWLRQRPASVATVAAPAQEPHRNAPAPVDTGATPAPKRKLSYKDARELAELPQRIEALEGKLAELSARMHEPAFYQSGGAAIVAANTELAALQAELERAYERWQALL